MSKILSTFKTIQKINKSPLINSCKFPVFLGQDKYNKSKNFYSNSAKNFSTDEHPIDETAEKVKFTFKHMNETKADVEVNAPVGRNILRVAHDAGIELEGACDCSLACSTCHVVFSEDIFDDLDESKDEEEDLLDLAFGLTDTSRLGCQVIVSKLLEGTIITIPEGSRNMIN